MTHSHVVQGSDKLSSAFYQPYVDAVGSYAKSPYPAYTLASLLGASAPFGLASGRDLRRIPNHVPGQDILKSVAGGKNVVAGALQRTATALPPYWQLVGFAATIAGGGYIIDQGDVLNGSGTVTAWSAIYLFFHIVPTLRRPSLLPVVLTTSVATIGAGIHGCYYFSKTSWRGAIPGLTSSTN